MTDKSPDVPIGPEPGTSKITLAADEDATHIIYPMEPQRPVVAFVRRIDGHEAMRWTYYFKPNWWERLNYWLSGYEALWDPHGEKE